ncbi:hypothetical protein JW921_02445, partial [Candidatus Fermentibacterales bacterium]|nr:hypothetical protein [Candidatus Fermentibacterales bacterium]
MGVASRRLAWMQRRRAPLSGLLMLASLETLLVLGWVLLGAALVSMLVEDYLWLLAPLYLLACGLAAIVETAGPGRRLDPMTTAGVSSYAVPDGSAPRTERQFLRLATTPPSLLLLGLGLLPAARGRRSLPEAMSGVTVFELDVETDPRPPSQIARTRRGSALAFALNLVSSLAVAALVFTSST